MNDYMANKIKYDINLRLETQDDYYAVEKLTREAFWGLMDTTCNEHYLVNCLRKSPAFIPELDFVAEIEGKIVGNVMYSRANIIDESVRVHKVITFGPLSVLPKYWHGGIGYALMKHSILKARNLGYSSIIIHGHPDYYPRFGFQNAKIFGITDSSGINCDAFMALELYDGALRGIKGKFYEDSVFECDEKESQKYDERFPSREPAQMTSIDVLLEKLPTSAQKAFREQKITTLAWLNRISGREMLLWNGVDEGVIKIVNTVLREYNYSAKLLPGCEVLERAKMGIKVLDMER